MDEKVLRSRDWTPTDKGAEELPILAGKSSIYCVKRLKKGYTLSAYDSHGNLLYRSPEYVQEWAQGIACSNDIRGRHSRDFRLFQGRGGVELIFSVHHTKGSSTTIRIINGATGLAIYQADYDAAWDAEVHADLFTDTFAIVMSKPNEELWRDHTALRSAITQMLSYQFEEAVQLVPLSTDVMFFPTYHNAQSRIVNPYTRVGFSICHNQWGGPTHAQSHDMAPTADEEFLVKARDLLQVAFKSETPPALRQCLVSTDGVVIQLPKRPSKKRCEWIDFDFREHLVEDAWFSSSWFTNKGYVLYEFGQEGFCP
ncbi:hypothetical protein BJX65DRAFT_126567 [Aspergillus insuetus]